MPEDLIAVNDVAQLLGVSRAYVNRLALNEQMPAPHGVLPSGQRIWKRSDVMPWIEERRARQR